MSHWTRCSVDRAALRRVSLSLLAVLTALMCSALAPASAHADTLWSLGLRAGIFEGTGASDLYDLLYDGDSMTRIGVQGQVEWTNGSFLRLAAETGSVDGQLVEPDANGGFNSVDTSSELTLTPFHLSLGWVARPAAPWSLYLGGGPTLLDWEEEIDSPFIESSSGTDVGVHALIGLRYAPKAWAIAGEARWSTIDALGDGGISALLDESDLGGVGVFVVVSYRFGL